jgi:tetratricopeptide (TPR) repeat protein
MGDDKKAESPVVDGTSIDLGEDLLEPTVAGIVAPNRQPSDTELFENGEILLREKLFDDAKKVFRKLLRKDPGNLKAKAYLDEIQAKEIQDLLTGEQSRKRYTAQPGEEESASAILEKLDRDLSIEIDKREPKAIPDLFPDEMALSKYKNQVLEKVSLLAPGEMLEFGIAHLEMGLFEVAQAVFEGALRFDERRVEAMYLLGISLIYGDKAIEATIQLEPLARDMTLPESQKTDFLYLMGLAFEKLADTKKAREFYRRVYLLNPRYRDVHEKLK